MSFRIEDQYQQFLYPDAIDYIKNERSGRVPVYQEYNKNQNNNNQDMGYGTKKNIQRQGPGPRPGSETEPEPGRESGPTTNRAGPGRQLPAGSIKILILNNPSKLNKRLIKFFISNLDYMNSKNIFFDWIVVYEDEMEHYEEQDITEFPMLITNREKIAGVNAIINRLQSIINETKQGQRGDGSNGQADEGEIRNYFLRELDDKRDDDMDEDDVFAHTITQRVASMNKARQASGQHSLKNSNPEIHEQTARAASRNKNYSFNEQNNRSNNKYRADNRQGRNDNKPRRDNLEYTPPEETPRQDAPSAADIARRTNTGSIDDELMMKYWENNELTDL